MKRVFLSLLLLAGLASGPGTPGNPPIVSRETRELELADVSLVASLMVAGNPKSRYLCTENPFACFGARSSELALSLIAARSSVASNQYLARLVRLRLDAGLAEDYRCLVLAKGRNFTEQLTRLDPIQLANLCPKEVAGLRKREAQGFAELDVSAVCVDAAQIREKIDALLTSLRSGTKCGSF